MFVVAPKKKKMESGHVTITGWSLVNQLMCVDAL